MKLFRPVLPNEIQITGSKSESNRLLILQKLFGNIEIKNISNSQDTKFLQKKSLITKALFTFYNY